MDRTVRRLAAIVAADVVGYSRKVEADERATLAALKDLLTATIAPLLFENNGRMIKTMGDGFIAEFGSVVDAVTFAVAMQRAVPQRQAGTAIERRLVFRVGSISATSWSRATTSSATVSMSRRDWNSSARRAGS
jgi:class 3 adenylate cyclase